MKMSTYSKPVRAHIPSDIKSSLPFATGGHARYNLKPEGLFSDFSSLLSNANLTAAQSAAFVGKLNDLVDSFGQYLPAASTVSLFSNFLRFISLSRSLTSISVLSPIDLINWIDTTSQIIMSVWDIYSRSSPSSALSRFYRAVKSQIATWRISRAVFLRAEVLNGVEAMVAITTLEAILPKKLRGLLSAAPLYTRTKILDDSTLFDQMLGWITDLPVSIARRLGVPDVITSQIEYIFSLLPGSKVIHYKNKMAELVVARDRKPHLVNDALFQTQTLSLIKEVEDWKLTLLTSHSSLPYGFSDVYERMKKLVIKVNYMKATSRVEPVFMVFGGPPNTGKSVIMSKLVKSMQPANSVYIHNPAEKDFYDNYDFEDILVIDDIGQKGIHQWSNMINFVSCCQCTLDCAQAENKDTKRFVSRAIFATTNLLKNMSLTPSDPIADIGALYRRVHYIDFSRMQFISGNHVGYASLQRFDSLRKAWTEVDGITMSAGDSSQKFLDWAHAYLKKECVKCTANFAAMDSEVERFPHLSAETFPVDQLLSNLLSILSSSTAFWITTMAGLAALFYFATRPAPLVKPKTKLYWSDKKKPISMATWRAEYDAIKPSVEPIVANPTLTAMSKNACVISSCDADNPFASSAMISGRVIFSVCHILSNLKVGSSFYLKIYGPSGKIFYDGVKVTVSYVNKVDDFVVLVMPRETLVFFRKLPWIKESSNVEGFLITPKGVCPTGVLRLSTLKQGYTAHNGTVNYVDQKDYAYEVRGYGICGSWFVNEDGFVLGHHVAGDDKIGLGITKHFSPVTLSIIQAFINDSMYTPPQLLPAMEDHSLGPSVVQLKSQTTVPVNTKNSIVPSMMHGIMPVLRAPANLLFDGRNSTRSRSSLAFSNTASVSMISLLWVVSYMKSILPTFAPLSLHDTLNGKDELDKIRLDTSAGLGLPGKKGDYVNVSAAGVYSLKSSVTDMIDKFKSTVLSGEYVPFLPAYDCLKVELRNLEKVDKPRVFSAIPFAHFLVERQMFGELVNKLHRDPYTSGVMVGINPFSAEWARLQQYMVRYGDNIWDGDVANWDKNMLPTFQRELHALLLSKFVGSLDEKAVAAQVLEDFVSALHCCDNISYVTTHSLPSGRFLTADYNSLIHKMLNLYIFHVLYMKHNNKRQPTFQDYDLNVSFAAYGDDSLTGSSALIKEWFNGPNMQKEFQALGMDFTPASKEATWSYETRSIMQCSFLKRDFAVHRSIPHLVAPLEVRSMDSTLNFVKDDFRRDELSYIKLLNYQREAYLHPDYLERMTKIKSYLTANDIRHPVFHSEEQLQAMYHDGTYFSLFECS